MINILLPILFLIFSFNISFSQLTEQWVARYNGSDNFNDVSNSIAVDNSGNVYVTGVSFFESGFEDIITVKYNSEGDQQWIKRFNSPDNSNDKTNSVIVDQSGNIIVTGESLRRETGRDIITIKYNSSGELLWSVTYNNNGTVIGINDDIGTVLRSDKQNNIYVGGTSKGSTTGYDYVLLKYDSGGNQIFVKRYTGPGNRSDIIHDLKTDSAGNIYVTGESGYPAGGSSDYLTIKYDPAGNTLWTARYDGPISFGDIARSICTDEKGNVFVTGTSTGPNLEDILTIKYDPLGIMLWETRYDGLMNLSDNAYSLDIDRAGNIYVAGGSTGETSFPEFTIIKYNTLGYPEWVRSYIPLTGGSGEAIVVKVDRFNKIYAGGTINRAISQSSVNDFALIQYDTSGNRRSVNFYNGPVSTTDFLSAIETDNSGNVYVTGKSNGSLLNYDYAVLKYSALSNIHSVSDLIPLSFELEQNYPNPFNPKTVIRFSLSESCTAALKIFDALGKEVAIPINEKLNAGTYETEFDASDLPSAVYFYKLSAGGFEYTKKMLLIR